MKPNQFQRLLNLANLLEQMPGEIDQFLTDWEMGLAYSIKSSTVNPEDVIRQSIEVARQRQERTNSSILPGQTMADTPGQKMPLRQSKTPKQGIPLPEVELDRGQVPELVGRDRENLFKDIRIHINKKQM